MAASEAVVFLVLGDAVQQPFLRLLKKTWILKRPLTFLFEERIPSSDFSS